MATIVAEVAIHAISIMTLTTLAVLFRGPIKNVTKTIVLIALGHGRSVSGDWSATLSVDDQTYEQTVNLRQFADFIWGTIACPTTGRTFRLTGRVVHHTVIARYELRDGSEITVDNGTFSLRLNDDGDVMRGHLTCPTGRAHEASSCEYVWRRATPVSKSKPTESNPSLARLAVSEVAAAR